jgi:hypothetical protein
MSSDSSEERNKTNSYFLIYDFYWPALLEDSFLKENSGFFPNGNTGGHQKSASTRVRIFRKDQGFGFCFSFFVLTPAYLLLALQGCAFQNFHSFSRDHLQRLKESLNDRSEIRGFEFPINYETFSQKEMKNE